MADWGLQAVIRPKEYDEDHAYSYNNDDNHQHQYQERDDCFGSIDIKKEYDQALLFCYPHLFDHHHDDVHATTSTMDTVVAEDELDQLYKPFYPAAYVSESQFPAASADLQTNHHREIQQDQEQEIHNFCGSASNTSKVAPKIKKRKNQQKRVVVQVTADGLSSDPWAWRKYGQKPIKGSIYPRSYYRCSSSKGCLARRQVEQSCTDSSIYILTYTAEHNHPQPTRRNSLAGINRNKFKTTTPKSPTLSDEGKTITKSKDSPFHSPTSFSSTEEETLSQSFVKQETMFYNKCDNQGHMMMGSVNDDDYMVFSDDFFAGLDDLGGYIMEPSSYGLSSEQMPSVFS